MYVRDRVDLRILGEYALFCVTRAGRVPGCLAGRITALGMAKRGRALNGMINAFTFDDRDET